MKRPVILLFGLVGILVVMGIIAFWPARPVPKSRSRQTIKYNAVKNVTLITRNGDTFMMVGNLTNGTALKALRPSPPDVGVVDFTDHTPKYFSLGGNRSCTISGTTNGTGGPQMITIEVVFQQTNADKTVQILGTPRLSVSAGHPCRVSMPDISVQFMPKF